MTTLAQATAICQANATNAAASALTALTQAQAAALLLTPMGVGDAWVVWTRSLPTTAGAPGTPFFDNGEVNFAQ